MRASSPSFDAIRSSSLIGRAAGDLALLRGSDDVLDEPGSKIPHANGAGRYRLPSPHLSGSRRTASDVRQLRPIGDDIFAVYRRQYSYDRTPMNAVVEATEETEIRVKHAVVLDTADGGERVSRRYAGPIRYARIISWSSCSTMWQCHTKRPARSKVAFTRVISPG